MNSLLALRFIRSRLEKIIDAGINEIEQDIEAYRSGFSPKPLPITPYLDIEFRSFVTEVRRIINKISELFPILTDADIPSGQFHRAIEWAERSRGIDSVLTKSLKSDQQWLKLWIDMRIAIEHPKKDRYVKAGAQDLVPKPTDEEFLLSILLHGSANIPPDCRIEQPDRLRREYIEHVVNVSRSNVSLAARQLQLDRRSLQRLLSRGGISPSPR